MPWLLGQETVTLTAANQGTIGEQRLPRGRLRLAGLILGGNLRCVVATINYRDRNGNSHDLLPATDVQSGTTSGVTFIGDLDIDDNDIIRIRYHNPSAASVNVTISWKVWQDPA